MKKTILILFALHFGIILSAQSWTALGSGLSGFIVNDMEVDSADQKLWVAGNFNTAGGITAPRLATWDGITWASPLTSCDNPIKEIYRTDTNMFIGGECLNINGVTVNCIASYNGGTITPLGGGMSKSGSHTAVASVNTIQIFQGKVIAGGVFDKAGSNNCGFIAQWDGTDWQPLGTGIASSNPVVYSTAIYNNELYVAGSFTLAGGMSVGHIAKWNGTTWSGVSSGMNGPIYKLKVVNGELIAVGAFTNAGGTPCSKIAVWNGFGWGPIGAGFNSDANTIGTWEGDLVVGGIFTGLAGGGTMNRIARWDGSNWNAMGDGFSALVFALAEDTVNKILYAGGSFTASGSTPVSKIAQWAGAVSIDNANNQNVSFGVWPNPASDDINIELPENFSGDLQLSLTDVSGKIHLQQSLSPSQRSLSIEQLKAGVYFLSITDGLGIRGTQKILVD